MARRAILYIDLLGVQKMWGQGGPERVKNRINQFNSFVIKQLNYLQADLHRDGEYNVILMGDAVAIITQDFEQAIGIGVHMFQQAFYATKDSLVEPFWLRGAISNWSNQAMPHNTSPIKSKGLQVGTYYGYEDDMLKVIALEKSGFKGMRLVINQDLLPYKGREFQVKWERFNSPLGSVTHLKECNYPKDGQYLDVLWMVENEIDWKNLNNIMASRFKTCTSDQDEFVQAAWTRAVFDQVNTLIWACTQKLKNSDSMSDRSNL